MAADSMGRPSKAGYFMAESIEIKNFRCFSEATLANCRRVNVLVGANGAGKTALMEGIFLTCGLSPEIALRTRNWRGFEGNATGAPRALERALWGDLFFNYDFKNTVSIELTGSRLHTRELTVRYQERNITIASSRRSQETGWSPVQFVWKGHNNRTLATSIPKIVDGKISIDPAPTTPLEALFFAQNQTYSANETANRFSELSKTQKEREVIEVFLSHFDFISDLSIELNGGNAMVFAKVAYMHDKMPLNIISGGLNKIATILFSFPIYTNGIILIDEIENGLYYKLLPHFWRSLSTLAKHYEMQVFASTHSLECLRAAAEAARDDPTAFSLIRIVRGDNGSIIRQFGGDDFASAIDDEIEVR